MIYYRAEIKNTDNLPRINEILEDMEVDIGEDLEAERAKLLQEIKDLGEDELYQELKEFYTI